jgi:hypothetical protein
VLRGREMMHIHADLRDQLASRHPVHAGDGLPEGDGRFEGADLLVNFRLDALNPSLQCLPFVQVLGQQKPVVVPHPSGQSLR